MIKKPGGRFFSADTVYTCGRHAWYTLYMHDDEPQGTLKPKTVWTQAGSPFYPPFLPAETEVNGPTASTDRFTALPSFLVKLLEDGERARFFSFLNALIQILLIDWNNL